MTGVERGLGQATDGFHQFLPSKVPSFSQCLSLHQFSQHGGASYGWDTSLRQKAYFLNPTVRHSQSEFYNVAANRILQLDG